MLVEQKSKQTALNDKPEPMSLPINDLSYSKYQPMIICENLKLCILQKTTYLAFEQSGHLIFNRSLTDSHMYHIYNYYYNQMLQINKVSMLVVCDYMCCCWLIYKSTVRGFILLSFAFSIHSFLISLPRSRNGAKASQRLHLNIYKPTYKRCTLWSVNYLGARDPPEIHHEHSSKSFL